MAAKKELARRIVAGLSFAGSGDTEPSESWAKQFQKKETPNVIDQVIISKSKILAGTGDPGWNQKPAS